MKTAAVIGSGIAGLAAAIRLAIQGFQVTVFEANSTFGGKMTEYKLNGFRFDKGSAPFTMPHLIDDLFLAAGRRPQTYFRYQPLEVNAKYFFPDGSNLNAYCNPKKFSKEIEKNLGVPAKEVKWFLKSTAQLYDATSTTFLHRSLHRISTYLHPDLLKTLVLAPRLRFTKTIHQANAADFTEPRFVQLLDHLATYHGSNPYEAPATQNIVPHLKHNIGSFYPEGGIYAIAKSLHRLATDLGIKFRFYEKAEEITLSENGKKVTGLRTSLATYRFDLVVSNMDVAPTYRDLLPGLKAPAKFLKQPRSGSALIFYWGMNRTFPELDLHNVFFSQNHQQEFEHIYKHKTVFADPTVYVNISSKVTKTDAPADHENWYVMLNAPNHNGQDWDQLVAEARQNVIRKLNQQLQTDISQHIICESSRNPRDIEKETFSEGGSLFGNSPRNALSAFLRHPNFNRQVKGLYFCGSSVHPGGGLPLCLLSAKIVSDLVKKDFRTK